jgi:hypothetical protein
LANFFQHSGAKTAQKQVGTSRFGKIEQPPMPQFIQMTTNKAEASALGGGLMPGNMPVRSRENSREKYDHYETPGKNADLAARRVKQTRDIMRRFEGNAPADKPPKRMRSSHGGTTREKYRQRADEKHKFLEKRASQKRLSSAQGSQRGSAKGAR